MRNQKITVIAVLKPNNRWYMKIQVGTRNVVEVKDGVGYLHAVAELEDRINKWRSRSEDRLRNKYRSYQTQLKTLREAEPTVNRGIPHKYKRTSI